MQSAQREKISPEFAIAKRKKPYKGCFEDTRHYWRKVFFLVNDKCRQPNTKLARRMKRRKCNNRSSIRYYFINNTTE